MEMWKAIKDYEGLYEVSNFGRVRALARTIINKNGLLQRYPEKFLKFDIADAGSSKYHRATLSKDHITKKYSVHRLVAETFIKNEFNKPCVNHINGIKTDNRIENLDWCTHKENTEHSLKNDLRKTGCNHKQSKLSLKDIEYIRKNYKYRDEEFSGKKLSEKFNVSHTCISQIIKNKTYRIY